jgi:hypothetical protein
MKTNHYIFDENELKLVNSSKFKPVPIGNKDIIPYLFHTGYLTIDKIVETPNNTFYNLKTPNYEINNDYYRRLIEYLSNILVEDNKIEYDNLFKALIKQDAQALTDIITVVYSRIPAEHHNSTESFYHVVWLAYCLALVPNARAEEPSSIGDLDIILTLKDDTYVVFELKYRKEEDQAKVDVLLKKLAVKALNAIKKKKYGETYKRQGKKFITVGLGVYGRGEVKVLFGS